MLNIEKICYYECEGLIVQLRYLNDSDFVWKFSYPRGKTFRPLRVDFNFMVDGKFYEGVYPQDIYENKDDEFVVLQPGEKFDIKLNMESWMDTLKVELSKLNTPKKKSFKVWVCMAFIFDTIKFGELFTDYEMYEFKIKNLQPIDF